MNEIWHWNHFEILYVLYHFSNHKILPLWKFQILDYNFAMGNHLLTMCLSVLVCCPSPHKYPSEHFPPNYSLWLLTPYCRHSWLQSTLVIMYKVCLLWMYFLFIYFNTCLLVVKIFDTTLYKYSVLEIFIYLF